MATERDPLLALPIGLPEPGAPEEIAEEEILSAAATVKKKQLWPRRRMSKIGPMELKRNQRWAILAGVWTSTFLSALNTTLVATLLSSISSEFQQANQASWLGTSYLLATCTCTPLYGRLCNVMGRRGANQTAVLFAGLGVLACGLSKSMPVLIAARFLSGMGGGGIFTTSSIIISDMYSLRDRSLTTGIASIFNGLGMGLGGPLGGIISDSLGWRWAFLLQMPLFIISFLMTGYNLNYVTPGRGKNTKDILKRIDYGGFFTLFIAVGSVLLFLSFKFNEDLQWSDPRVFLPLIVAGVFAIIFVVVELFISPEPVMAPFLLTERDPVLISISNFLVAICNFAVMYFFPTWFQTVNLDSASTAGLHLMPNSISMSLGSLFAGWHMQKTGEYKSLMVICGIFPFMAGVLIAQMTETSGFIAKWISIIPLGFGNAVVLQTTLIALLTAIPHSAMAVGTGFGQLFRGIGQVFGVAIASAIFQYLLDKELHNRIDGPGSEDLIRRIRQSIKVVATLPPEMQRHARDAYAISLRAVFITAACCTLTAYIVRLFVKARSLDHSKERPSSPPPLPETAVGPEPLNASSVLESGADRRPPARPIAIKHARRFSMYESEPGHDPEVEGQALARSFSGRSPLRRSPSIQPQRHAASMDR